MQKHKSLRLEYIITIVIIIAVVVIIMPFDFSNNAQANFISRWNDKYLRLEYMFQVINAHENEELLTSLNNAKTCEERERILINIIQPYFRIHKENLPRKYVPKFMNNIKVPKTSHYYFEDTYLSENGMIVGIKDLDFKTESPLFIMMFDINGVLPPNTWGKDIYGVNIYENFIAPFGFGMTTEELRRDCSAFGTGIACSYYYKIGGGFSD